MGPIIQEALDFIWNLDTESVFKHPLSKKSAPAIYDSYVKVIPVPMDLSTMRQHATKGDYRHLGSFEEDLMRIFKNCRYVCVCVYIRCVCIYIVLQSYKP